jgi:hypothetical protein
MCAWQFAMALRNAAKMQHAGHMILSTQSTWLSGLVARLKSVCCQRASLWIRLTALPLTAGQTLKALKEKDLRDL